MKIKFAEYGRNHRPECNAYNRTYKKRHRDEIRQKNAIYRETHRAELRARGAIYRHNHIAERNAFNSKRRALIVGVTIGNLIEIKEIFRRAREDMKVRCYLCGKLIPVGQRHVDHVVPLSGGGQHRASNLAIACEKCNLSKGTKMPSTIGLLL